MDNESIFARTVDFVKDLTWRRVAQLVVLAVLAACGMLFWINKEYVAGELRPQSLSPDKLPLDVTDKEKAAIEATLKKSSFHINTFIVTAVDIERNTRRVVHFSTSNIEVERANAEFMRTHITADIPLFNDDADNNRRLIQLINGEMVCVAFMKSNSGKYLGNVGGVKYTCATAVPPYYGKFRGILLAFITVPLDAEEQVRVRILMRELSSKLDNPSSARR